MNPSKFSTLISNSTLYLIISTVSQQLFRKPCITHIPCILELEVPGLIFPILWYKFLHLPAKLISALSLLSPFLETDVEDDTAPFQFYLSFDPPEDQSLSIYCVASPSNSGCTDILHFLSSACFLQLLRWKDGDFGSLRN